VSGGSVPDCASVAQGGASHEGHLPTELDELVDAMVLLLARNSVAQARAGLVARVVGAKRSWLVSAVDPLAPPA
jgi:hypothetical protein